MPLALNKQKLDNLTDEIWKSAERLRGKFKAYEYQSVILPIIVIRRLECVLIDWRTQKAAEILPNRYFYRYEPPTPAKDLLKEFWRLEKEAEKLLEGLAQ
jgi:type I restriction-modification system DNA methylase subunit